MKKVKFLNILILINFFYLNSCHKEPFIEKKDPLEAMSNSMIDKRESAIDDRRQILDSEDIFSNQSEPLKEISEEDYLRLIHIFGNPEFINRLIATINIKAPGENIFSFLYYIKDKNDGFALYRIFNYDFKYAFEYRRMDHSDERRKKIDSQWERFKKITQLDHTLENVLTNFKNLIKNIESKKGKSNNKVYSNALARCGNFLDQRIRPYDGKSIEYLKLDEDFIILLDDSISLIDEFSNLELEGDLLESLKSDLELLRDFFKKIKAKRDLDKE